MKQILGALAGLALMLAGHGANATLTSCQTGGPGGSSVAILISPVCIVEKTFNQIDSIGVTLSADSNDTYLLTEVINNDTGITWTDFHWELFEEFGNVTFDLGASNFGSFVLNAALSNATTIWVDGNLPSGQTFGPTIAFNVPGGFPGSPGTPPGGFWFVDQFPTIATPEPGTLALLGIGLLGLGIARRKRHV